MKYNLIVAMDPNGVIGKDGGIPWYFKEDLAFFKAQTTGSAVIMGRKTWDSLLVKPLPNRDNYVITGDTNKLQRQGMFNAWNSLPALVNVLNSYSDGEAYFIGGASIYQWALNNVKFDNMYLTITKKEYDGDVIFPVEDYVTYKYKNIPYTTTSEEFDDYIRYHHTFPRKEDV